MQGGWGIKKGLLGKLNQRGWSDVRRDVLQLDVKSRLEMLTPESPTALDPDSGYEEPQDRSEYTIDFDSEPDFTHRSAFRQVVCPGDAVTFYILDATHRSKSRPQDMSQIKSSKPATSPSVVLDTLPSGLDDMPALVSNDTAVLPLHIRDYFGMASESMVLTIDRLDDRCRSSHASGQVDNIVQTKIDVPYAHCLIW